MAPPNKAHFSDTLEPFVSVCEMCVALRRTQLMENDANELPQCHARRALGVKVSCGAEEGESLCVLKLRGARVLVSNTLTISSALACQRSPFATG